MSTMGNDRLTRCGTRLLRSKKYCGGGYLGFFDGSPKRVVCEHFAHYFIKWNTCSFSSTHHDIIKAFPPDGSRADGIDTNVVLSHFDRYCFRQADDPHLRTAIGTSQRVSCPAVARRPLDLISFTVSSNLGRSRDATTILAPSEAKAPDMALPMPFPPPVTIATLSFSL